MIRSRRLVRAGRAPEAEQLWCEQHERGAGQIFDIMADLKGFYLKVGIVTSISLGGVTSEQ